jgi:hypothetical protein
MSPLLHADDTPRTGGSSSAVSEWPALSASPAATTLLPSDRPAWVAAAPDLSTSTHRLFVGSLPAESPEQADAALDGPLVSAVQNYIDDMLPHARRSTIPTITPSFIRRNLLDSSTQYTAKLNTNFGTHYQKWVVVQITPQDREQFNNWLRQAKQNQRMLWLGGVLLSLICLIAAIHRTLRRIHPQAAVSLPPGTCQFLPEERPLTARDRRIARRLHRLRVKHARRQARNERRQQALLARLARRAQRHHRHRARWSA